MADIINLKRVRKLKQRQAASRQAAENRTKHGRTKAQKHMDEKRSVESQHRMDLLRIEHPSDSDSVS